MHHQPTKIPPPPQPSVQVFISPIPCIAPIESTRFNPVRWPSGLRRQLKVIPFVVHQYNRWSERAWVQIPLSSTLSFVILMELGLTFL